MSILDADYIFYIDTPERDSQFKGASIAGFEQGQFYGLGKKPKEFHPSFFEDRNGWFQQTKIEPIIKQKSLFPI